MRAGTQTTISLLFLVGSVIISLVTVQANFPNYLAKYTVPSVVQNFHVTNNKLLNKRVIPDTLEASYKYLAMASYFSRADVALPGFSKYFRKASDRHLDNANNLMTYINLRGGMIKFRDIRLNINGSLLKGPEPGIVALKTALEIEIDQNDNMLAVLKHASKSKDVHLKHILEDQYLDQEVKMIKEYADHLAALTMMRGEKYGIGEYMFDKNL